MTRIENETVLPVPAAPVPEVLLAFDRHGEWHPFIGLRGEAMLGAEIDYICTTTWFSRPTAKGVDADAVRITIARMPREHFGIQHSTIQTEQLPCEDAESLHP